MWKIFLILLLTFLPGCVTIGVSIKHSPDSQTQIEASYDYHFAR